MGYGTILNPTNCLHHIRNQSASDSTKRVEWWLEEKAALGALDALVRCWRWAPSDGPKPAAGGPAADEKGPNGHAEGSDLDSLDNAIPSLDEVLGDDEPLLSDAAASASSAEEWAILEAQWSEVTRVLLHSVGGAVVAQLVQSLLAIVGKDRDRDVRLLALAALEGMVGLLPSPAVWRPFFPGVFSGLLKVVLAGSGEAASVREGSRLGAAALRVALTVTAMMVSPEANAELAPLLVRGMGGLSLSGDGDGASGGDSSSSSAWASFQAAVLSSMQPPTSSTKAQQSRHSIPWHPDPAIMPRRLER